MSASAEVRPYAASSGPDSGQVLAGRYELGEVCGVGGFARVYQARDRRIGTMVAVKLLDAVPRAVERSRFAREVEISASIVHPNLVRITDTGEHDGRPYAVMPLLHGRVLAQRRGADWRQVCRWMRQFLDGVRALHEARAFTPAAAPTRVLHRDIKPANCFVSDDGHLTILDFGLVKLLDRGPRVTATHAILGTSAYMAPECLFALPASERSDVYSLGVTFFEMLTGELPYTGGLADLHERHAKALPAPSVRDLRPEIPADLAELVQMAMAPLPADRHESVARMLRKLDSILRRIGDVAAAPPTPRPEAAPTPRPAAAPPTPRLALALVQVAAPVAEEAARRPWARIMGLALAATAVICAAALGLRGDGGDVPRDSFEPPPRTEPAVHERSEPLLPARPEPAAHEPASPTPAPASVESIVMQPGPAVSRARVPAKQRRSLDAAAAILGDCHAEFGAGEPIAVEVEVVVTADGAVTHAKVVGRLQSPTTLCVQDALRAMRFPPGARREVLRRTFHLAPRSQ